MKNVSFKKVISITLCYSMLIGYNLSTVDGALAVSEDSSLTMLTARAIYYFNQDRLDHSLQTWLQILEQDPNHKLANEYIDKIKNHKERKLTISDENIDAIEKRPLIIYSADDTIQTDNIESIIYHTEIKAYKEYSNKNYRGAADLYRKILDLDFENIRIRILLATLLMKAGMYEKAYKEWENVLEFDEHNPQAKSYIKLINESTFDELDRISDSITVAKPKTSTLLDKPIFTFEGFETSLLFDGYFTNRTNIDEHTLHLATTSTFRSTFYDNPLNLVVAADGWRTRGDYLQGVGQWDNGDYELNHRFRQTTLQFYGKEIQILAGDISTHYLFSKNPSHFFVYPGIDYRGINVIFKAGKFRSKVMWGFMPFYELRKATTGAPRIAPYERIIYNGESMRFRRDYFYPREITSVDFQYELNPQYTFGAIFAHTDDHSAIKKISDRFPIQDNYIVSFNQSFNIIPGKHVQVQTPAPHYKDGKHVENFKELCKYLSEELKWYVFHEFAYSWNTAKIDNSREIYTRNDALNRNENLNDWATYVRSEMSIPKVHSEIMYQRIEPNFRNTTGFTYANSITYDRELIEAKTYFYPLRNLNFSLNSSALRSDLDNNRDYAKQNWQSNKLNMRWLPENEPLPDVSMDLVLENYRSSDSSEFVPNDWNLGSYCIGLSKNILEWDVHGTYKFTWSEDDQHVYNQTYYNFWSFEAFKTLHPGVDFSFGHFYKHEDANRPTSAWDFDRDYTHTDVTFNFDLWDTSSLSLFYSYLIDKDNVFHNPDNARVHAFSATFGWPIYFRNRFDHQIDINPYITCLVHESGRTHFDNIIVEPTLQFKYKLDSLNYFSLTSSYRHDTGYEDEFRFYMYLNFGLDIRRIAVPDVKQNPRLKSYVSRQHIVNANDALIVELIRIPEYSTVLESIVTVNQDGYIEAPFFTPVSVTGKTLEEAERLISQNLSAEHKKYEVQISPSAKHNNSLLIIGEVRKQGVYSFTNNITVIEALSLAGGTNTYRADHSRIKITRPSTQEKFTVDLTDYVLNSKTSQNIVLQSGDIISVPKTIDASAGDIINGLFGKPKKSFSKEDIAKVDLSDQSPTE